MKDVEVGDEIRVRHRRGPFHVYKVEVRTGYIYTRDKDQQNHVFISEEVTKVTPAAEVEVRRR